MNIADVVVIITILIACIAGFYKGLLNTLYKLITYILAIYLSFKLAKPVSGWFQGTSIYLSIQDGITTFVTNLGINFTGLENMNPETISQSISRGKYTEPLTIKKEQPKIKPVTPRVAPKTGPVKPAKTK